MDYRKDIGSYLEEEMDVIRCLDIDAINIAMNVIVAAKDRGGDIYIFGNGGSAATASHFVCDYNKGLSDDAGTGKYRFRCLSDNIPIVTAIANDYSYEDIFVKQLEGVLRPDDLLIAISGSGNSKNVIKAAVYAKDSNVPVIGITGYGGGELKKLADYNLHVPVDDMQITEDLHMMLDHMMMKILGKAGV